MEMIIKRCCICREGRQCVRVLPLCPECGEEIEIFLCGDCLKRLQMEEFL